MINVSEDKIESVVTECNDAIYERGVNIMLNYLRNFYKRTKKNKIKILLLRISLTLLFINFSNILINFIINDIIYNTPRDLIHLTNPDYTSIINLMFVKEAMILYIVIIVLLFTHDYINKNLGSSKIKPVITQPSSNYRFYFVILILLNPS